jgi:hypothetical protein
MAKAKASNSNIERVTVGEGESERDFWEGVGLKKGEE